MLPFCMALKTNSWSKYGRNGPDLPRLLQILLAKSNGYTGYEIMGVSDAGVLMNLQNLSSVRTDSRFRVFLMVTVCNH